MVAPFSSSQILWNKSGASIFVYFEAGIWSKFWSWILINLWYDVKVVTSVRALNFCARCAFGSVFSFVRTARPGKYFLIETEDGGGEVGDGPANVGGPSTLNKSAGALWCYCLGGWWLIDCFLQTTPLAARRRLEKCEQVKPWKEDHGKGIC